MTKQSGQKPAHNWLWKIGASVIGGLGIIASNVPLIPALANGDVVDNGATLETPAPAPVVATPTPAPAPVAAPTPKIVNIPAPAPVATPAPRKEIEIVAPSVNTSAQPPKVDQVAPLSQPKVSINEAPARANEIIQESGKNSFVDPTNYELVKPSPNYAPNPDTQIQPASPTVVLTERSNGCQTVVSGGQLTGGKCGAVAISKPSAPPKTVASYQRQTLQGNRVNRVSPSYTVTRRVAKTVSLDAPLAYQIPRKSTKVALSYVPINSQKSQSQSQTNSSAGYSTVPLNVPPEYYRAPRQMRGYTNNVYNYNYPGTSLIFPLSIPVSIGSGFGLRLHPISGVNKMHSGTDLPAPLGTPVLAAYPGEVATADWSGGYGLMVTLVHEEGSQESRYAHLSEVFVQPGEWVEQGTVIGLVGSTGFSTGPHLHFEWRHLTNSGWVAVDSGTHLEYALENLIQSLRLAQEIPNPNS